MTAGILARRSTDHTGAVSEARVRRVDHAKAFASRQRRAMDEASESGS